MDELQDVLAEAAERMEKSIEALEKDLGAVRTGRANPSLVESIMVDYYGTPTPLLQIASISVPEARQLAIQPWDKQALNDVEKAILRSDLGLMPNNDGTVIHITMPALTEERRRDLVRLVGKKIEEAHISIRNIRRNILEQLRKMERDKVLSKDEGRRAQGQLQKITDSHMADIDVRGKDKQAEVMEV